MVSIMLLGGGEWNENLQRIFVTKLSTVLVILSNPELLEYHKSSRSYPGMSVIQFCSEEEQIYTEHAVLFSMQVTQTIVIYFSTTLRVAVVF